MGIFKGRKLPKSPWDYLIRNGQATEEDYEKYEAALARGDVSEAQAIEAQTVSGIKRRKRS